MRPRPTLQEVIEQLRKKRGCVIFCAHATDSAAPVDVSPLPPGVDPRVVDPCPDTVQEKEKYTGTASCEIECRDGTCKRLEAKCDTAVSYEDAKKQLEASIEAQAKLEGGKIKEKTMSFKISIKF